MTIKTINDLKPDPNNANRGTERGHRIVNNSIQRHGAGRSGLAARDGTMIAGSQTLEEMAALGMKIKPVHTTGDEWVVVIRDDVEPGSEQATLMGLEDNRGAQEGIEWDPGILAELAQQFDVSGLFTGDELAEWAQPSEPEAGDEDASDEGAPPRATLAERFGVPPFSVLDARQGYWQERKRAWIALGIQSELGRGNENLTMSHPATTSTIDFYAQKRQLEAEAGRALTTQEVKAILAERGELKDDRAGNAARLAAHEAIPGGAGAASVVAVNGRRARNGAAATERGGPGTMDEQRKAWRGGQGVARSYAVNEWVRDTLPEQTGLSAGQSGTSIFDPVLCELVYRWFCPEGGAILDPFAGGSVRGIVAAQLGRAYTGIDLRPEQIAANEEQAQAIAGDPAPRWIVGDSTGIADLAPGSYDLIFSCPPYADLEVYSDNPADLSTMDYAAFLTAYRRIIAACVGMLQNNRFACFVVGDVRDKKGFYRNFVSDTIAAFEDSGARLYNEAILVTAVGSLPIRIAKQFEGYRKLGKTHQNVLVVYKGDPKRIKDFGPVEMGIADPAAEFGEVVE